MLLLLCFPSSVVDEVIYVYIILYISGCVIFMVISTHENPDKLKCFLPPESFCCNWLCYTNRLHNSRCGRNPSKSRQRSKLLHWQSPQQQQAATWRVVFWVKLTFPHKTNKEQETLSCPAADKHRAGDALMSRCRQTQSRRRSHVPLQRHRAARNKFARQVPH